MHFDRRGIFGASLAAGVGLASARADAGPRTSTIAATSPHSATWPGVLDAAQFGLIPDSGENQTARLQQAIDAAARAHLILHIPAGRYLVAGVLLRSGSRIRGAGSQTVLAYAGGGEFVSGKDAEILHLEDLTLDGNSMPLNPARSDGLLQMAGCRAVRLTRLEIRGALLNGISLKDSAGTVSACRISHCAGAGLFSLDAARAAGGLEISHNSVTDCGNNGILVWRSAPGEDGTLLIHNRIERIAARSGGSGQNGNGINIFRAANVLVSSNRIADCAFTAVRGNAASDLQILGNSCSRLGEVALYAEFAFEGALIANNLIDDAAHGISVTNFNTGGRLAVVQGNLVRNIKLRTGDPEPRGYGISVEADAAVTGNVIEGAPTVGLNIGWGRWMRDVTASGNIVRGCRIGIGVSGNAGAGRALLTGNMISGSKDGAIRTMDGERPYGPDLARPGAEKFTNIALSGNSAV